ncbi:hypothetical protein ACP3V3_16825 [Vibrio sp. PNB22_3_1]
MDLMSLTGDVFYYFFMGVVKMILRVGVEIGVMFGPVAAFVITLLLVGMTYHVVMRAVVSRSLLRSRQRHLNQRLIEYGYGLDFSEQVDGLLAQRMDRVVNALRAIDDVKAHRLQKEVRRDGALEVILSRPVLSRAFEEIGGLRRLETNPVMLKRI